MAGLLGYHQVMMTMTISQAVSKTASKNQKLGETQNSVFPTELRRNQPRSDTLISDFQPPEL